MEAHGVVDLDEEHEVAASRCTAASPTLSCPATLTSGRHRSMPEGSSAWQWTPTTPDWSC
uniref:Uncharacterized protein n=1 Tax=Arundo donax TaxID=35708 RepID=A0A0A9DKC3_ARUDO